jgi:adenylylsulfate kinase
MKKLQGGAKMRNERGFVVWLTGLSGAGKTTIAHALSERLREAGYKVEVLDGDVVRQHFSKGLGFSKEDRIENIRRVAYVAHLLARNGVVVITALISPYREGRDYARQLIGAFVEVYVKCPLNVLIERDVKGLYAKALKGEIPNFTGISDPYEPPETPEVVVETDKETLQESVDKIWQALEELGYISDTPIGADDFAATKVSAANAPMEVSGDAAVAP